MSMVRRTRILIVDDEELIVEMLTEALKNDSVEIHGAGDGASARRIFNERTIDIVLTDMMMPDLDGSTLVSEFKAIDPFVQFIFITGYPEIDKIAEILEKGANDFILKPFKLEAVYHIVQENIVRSKRWNEVRAMWREHKMNMDN